MNDAAGLSVETLLARLAERGAKLPFEIGAFVALEVCELLLRDRRTISAGEVVVGSEGQVSIIGGIPAADEVAARAVLDLLTRLLLAAGSGVPSMMLRLVEEGPSSGRLALEPLRDELEASLVPLNRAAARRVVARQIREVARRPSQPPPGRAGDVDADLDAFLGDGPPTKPTAYRADPTPLVPPAAWDPIPASAPPARPIPAPAVADETAWPTARRGVGALAADLELDVDEGARKSRMGLWIGLVLVVGGIGLVVAAMQKPAWLEAIRDAQREEPPPPAEPTRAAAPSANATRYGDLAIRSAADRAQFLLFVGRGPAMVEHLPVGVAHELVAIADGKAPTRVVVPADAHWDPIENLPETGPIDRFRYEIALQTRDEEMRFERLSLGPSQLTTNMGTPTGELGTVRVVTTPPGAKVYLLIGFSPSARIRNLRTDVPVELLVWADRMRPERVIVGPSDWVDGPDGRVADVTVELTR